MPDKTLERLNAHRDWANALYVEWFAGQTEFEPYCHKMFSHILLAEEVWLGRILERPHRGPWECLLSPAEMESMHKQHKGDWEKVLGGGAGLLERVFSYRRYNGVEASSSIVDAFTHVCTHGIYHRGQVASAAARAGLKIPSTDFILFADLG
jgi:uncharacterized damage-inducible protein DinB